MGGSTAIPSSPFLRLFAKQLQISDTNNLCKVTIPWKDAVQHILPWYDIPKPENSMEMDFPVFVLDSHSHENFKFVYWKSGNTFVVRSGWSQFVKRRGVCPGDTVTFFLSEDNHICIEIASSSPELPAKGNGSAMSKARREFLSPPKSRIKKKPKKQHLHDHGGASASTRTTSTKKFHPLRALGGHRASCYKSKEGYAVAPNKVLKTNRESYVCHTVFPNAQALAGHEKPHFAPSFATATTKSLSPTHEQLHHSPSSPTVGLHKVELVWDLNMPPADKEIDDAPREVELTLDLNMRPPEEEIDDGPPKVELCTLDLNMRPPEEEIDDGPPKVELCMLDLNMPPPDEEIEDGPKSNEAELMLDFSMP